MFILTNNNFARASRYYVHFVHMYDMNLPNFTSLVCGLGEHSKIIVTFFY